MSKFKIGDKVVGNDGANKEYAITKKGWVGTVKRYYGDGCIAVESLDHEHIYTVHEDDFDKFDSTQQRKIIITEEDQLIRVKVFKGEKLLCDGTEIGDDFMEGARKLLENCRPKIPELKDGYLLEIECEGIISFAKVYHNDNDELCMSGENHWYPIDCFDKYGEYHGCSITKIYGRTNSMMSRRMSIMCRNLIWERK